MRSPSGDHAGPFKLKELKPVRVASVRWPEPSAAAIISFDELSVDESDERELAAIGRKSNWAVDVVQYVLRRAAERRHLLQMADRLALISGVEVEIISVARKGQSVRIQFRRRQYLCDASSANLAHPDTLLPAAILYISEPFAIRRNRRSANIATAGELRDHHAFLKAFSSGCVLVLRVPVENHPCGKRRDNHQDRH